MSPNYYDMNDSSMAAVWKAAARRELVAMMSSTTFGLGRSLLSRESAEAIVAHMTDDDVRAALRLAACHECGRPYNEQPTAAANRANLPSHCPRCGYPDTHDGEHFKGIYQHGLKCELCGYLAKGSG